MNEPFNYELCQERHENLGEDMQLIHKRLKSVENRFLMIVGILLTNLVGVILILLK